MDISLIAIKKSLANFLIRFHFVLFIVTAVGSLAVAIFMLYKVIELSDSETGYTSSVNQISFDEATIKKLRNLKPSSEQTEKIQISGRANPFVE